MDKLTKDLSTQARSQNFTSMPLFSGNYFRVYSTKSKYINQRIRKRKHRIQDISIIHRQRGKLMVSKDHKQTGTGLKTQRQ